MSEQTPGDAPIVWSSMVLSKLGASAESVGGLFSRMWRHYMTVIAEKAETAVQILDRYHVMKKFGDKPNKVRAEETRQMKQDG